MRAIDLQRRQRQHWGLVRWTAVRGCHMAWGHRWWLMGAWWLWVLSKGWHERQGWWLCGLYG